MNQRRWRRHRHKDVEEINITAFMNLMVVLTPFLLITAVFSRLAILELNLPAGETEPTREAPEFQLEVTVRESSIEVGDRTAGVLNKFERGAGGHDLERLSAYLQEIKKQFPAKTDATLLLEPAISYQVVVEVMDALRVAERREADRLVRAELFPEISIGDAPLLN
jgi:biopolymer transport protein ExbD